MTSYFFRCLHATSNGKRRRTYTVEIPGAISLEIAYARVRRLHPQAFAIYRVIGEPGQKPYWKPQASAPALPDKERGSNPQLALPLDLTHFRQDAYPVNLPNTRLTTTHKRHHQRTRA